MFNIISYIFVGFLICVFILEIIVLIDDVWSGRPTPHVFIGHTMYFVSSYECSGFLVKDKMKHEVVLYLEGHKKPVVFCVGNKNFRKFTEAMKDVSVDGFEIKEKWIAKCDSLNCPLAKTCGYERNSISCKLQLKAYSKGASNVLDSIKEAEEG